MGLAESAGTQTEQFWDLGQEYTFTNPSFSATDPEGEFSEPPATIGDVEVAHSEQGYLEAPFYVVLDANMFIYYLSAAEPLFEARLCGHEWPPVVRSIGNRFRQWLCLAAEGALSRPIQQSEGMVAGWEPIAACNLPSEMQSEEIDIHVTPGRVRVAANAVRTREEYSPEEPEWTPESYRAHLAVEKFYEVGDADSNCSE